MMLSSFACVAGARVGVGCMKWLWRPCWLQWVLSRHYGRLACVLPRWSARGPLCRALEFLLAVCVSAPQPTRAHTRQGARGGGGGFAGGRGARSVPCAHGLCMCVLPTCVCPDRHDVSARHFSPHACMGTPLIHSRRTPKFVESHAMHERACVMVVVSRMWSVGPAAMGRPR